jgi:hypothetical protein
MFGPILLTGIEERHSGLGFWVDRRCDIATALITAMASQSKIIDIIRTLTRSRLNMINRKAIGA